MRYVYFAVAFYVVVYSLSLAGALLLRLHDAFRSRRSGGAPKPPALYVVSPVDVSTTGATLTSVDYFSSPGEPGSASAGVAIRPTPPRPSSGTALGFSGTSSTYTDSRSIGDHGLRLRLVDSDVA